MRILILHTSIGLGHKTLANNFEYYLKVAGFEVLNIDTLKQEFSSSKNLLSNIQTTLYEKFPWVWKWLYTNQTFTRLSLPLRVPLARFKSQRIESLIKDYKPDLIISTQTTPSAIISSLIRRKKYKGKFFIATSDYHFHPFWWYPEADGYLLNISEQVEFLEKLGVGSDRLKVVGMTLSPRQVVDKAEVRKRLGVTFNEKVALYISGSLGTGITKEKVQKLLSSLPALTTLVVVCGKNDKAYDLIKSIHDQKLVCLGYYSPLEELLGVANILITKPGGLTMAESLQYQVPVLVTHFLPGQEELNINYLNKRKLLHKLDIENLSIQEIHRLIANTISQPIPDAPEDLVDPQMGKRFIEAVRQLSKSS